MNHNNCLICNSNKIHELKGYESHQLGKCINCGFVFMLRIPSFLELDEYYSTYSHDGFRQLSPVTIDAYNHLINYFEKFRVNNNLLDVGCGRGWILEIAKTKGWNVYGTEYSDTAIKICEKKGIKMVKGDINSLPFNDTLFDVIISSEVIEHVTNFSIELKNIFLSLRSGGLFYLTTPNFNCYLRYQLKGNYNIIKYPEHLSYFTKRTLHTVLKKSGFKKLKLQTTGISINRMLCNKDRKIAIVNGKNTDEKLRNIMNQNNFMKIIKVFVNKILTITGLGVTIKAFYIKK